MLGLGAHEAEWRSYWEEEDPSW
eukprot:COSAG06_NODE_33666_length_486_cov_0.927649_1_plen_22_part_01